MEMKAENLAACLAAISVMYLVDGRTHARKAAVAASGSRLRPASRYKQRVFVISRPRLHGGRSHLGGLFFLLLLLFVFYAGWVGNVWREMKGEGEINTESKHARRGERGKNYASDGRTDGKL